MQNKQQEDTPRVLITGGAGFVGYHLAKRLSDQGQKVVIADNFFRSEKDHDLMELIKRENVTLIETDLAERDSWDKIPGQFDYVYHLAAINGTPLFYEMPHEVLRASLLTTIYALEWFRTKNQSGKILFTSSNEARDGALSAFRQMPIPTPENVPLVIEDPYNPRWSYAGPKIIGEQLFIHYGKQYGLRTVIVLPHNFYGPRAGFKHVIPEVIKRILQRIDPFPIYGADQARSFCYIDDAIEAMQLVMESEKTNDLIYNIGTGEETLVNDLANMLFKIAEWTPHTIDNIPAPEGSAMRRLGDVSKIKKDLGWEASTSLEGGLQKTFEWYKNYYQGKPDFD